MSYKKRREVIKEKFYNIKDDRIQIQLEFDSVSELFTTSINTKIPVLSEIAKNKLESVLKLDYRIINTDVYLYIKDKEGISNDEIRSILLDNLELETLHTIKIKRFINLQTFIMIFFGAIIILLGTFVFEKESSILSQIVNIAGTLLIWEASYLFFVDRSKKTFFGAKHANLIKNLIIM
ncbi:MAG: hypothetical protein ACRC5M_01045 [Anaeroplasmataceae bacterium]